MKIFLLPVTLIIFLSCNSKPNNRKGGTNNPIVERIIPDFGVALKFIKQLENNMRKKERGKKSFERHQKFTQNAIKMTRKKF